MGPIDSGNRFQPTRISWDGIGLFLMAQMENSICSIFMEPAVNMGLH